jgi:uncharacterized protein (UPF0333 family)
LRLQFKKEVSLLVLALALFAVGTFFYTYQISSGEANTMSQSLVYPYRGLAIAFVGIGSASMIVASISYSKKTKNLVS